MTLAGGAVGGWLLATVLPDRTLSLLTAFLGGAILLNVLDQERRRVTSCESAGLSPASSRLRACSQGWVRPANGAPPSELREALRHPEDTTSALPYCA